MALNLIRNRLTMTTTLFPATMFFFLFASNCICAIYQAYSRHDFYSGLGFVVYDCAALLWLDLCLTEYHKLPSQNRTAGWRRKFLQLAVWVLYSANMFGFSAYFVPLFGDPFYGYSLYAVSVVCSALLFYFNVIRDGSRRGCDECLGEEKVTKVISYEVCYVSVWRRYDSCRRNRRRSLVV